MRRGRYLSRVSLVVQKVRGMGPAHPCFVPVFSPTTQSRPTPHFVPTPDQAGFRKGRSTCDQVAALTTFIENGFQQHLKTGSVFLDLTAAYDTIWSTGLLYKLSKSMPYWFNGLVGLLLRD